MTGEPTPNPRLTAEEIAPPDSPFTFFADPNYTDDDYARFARALHERLDAVRAHVRSLGIVDTVTRIVRALANEYLRAIDLHLDELHFLIRAYPDTGDPVVAARKPALLALAQVIEKGLYSLADGWQRPTPTPPLTAETLAQAQADTTRAFTDAAAPSISQEQGKMAKAFHDALFPPSAKE